jgi:hypothetical protein
MTDQMDWTPPPLPDDPGERRRLRSRLLILAALALTMLPASVIAWCKR